MKFGFHNIWRIIQTKPHLYLLNVRLIDFEKAFDSEFKLCFLNRDKFKTNWNWQMFTDEETTLSRSQSLSIHREGGRRLWRALKGGGGGWNLTATYSTIAIVAFACKAVFGIVWDADSFVTARIYVAGFADTLLKKKNTKTKKHKQKQNNNNRYITCKQ